MTDTVDSKRSAEALTASGVARLDHSDSDLTVADFTRAIQIDPKNASNFRYRGAAYVRNLEFDKAMADFDRAITLAPGDAVSYYLRGSVWHKKGSLVQAIFDYDKAIKLDPRNLKAIQAREVAVGRRHAADAEVGRTRSAATKSVLRRSMAVGGVLAVTLIGAFWWVHVKSQEQRLRANHIAALFHSEQGAVGLKERDYGRAISEYSASISADPRTVEAYVGRGKAKQGARDLDGALEDFKLALQIDPKNADAYAAQGKAFEELGNYERAVNDYSQWVSLSPRSVEAFIARASVLDRQNDFPRAIADWDHALRIDSNNRTAKLRKAAGIERWVAMRPRDMQAYLVRAAVRATNNDPTGALADIEQVLRADPSNSEAQARRAEVLQLLSAESSAYVFRGGAWLARRGVANSLQVASAVLQDARNSGKIDGYQAAIGDFGRLKVLDPENANTYSPDDFIRLGRADYDRAAADLNKGIEISPKDPDAVLRRVMVRELRVREMELMERAGPEAIATLLDLIADDWFKCFSLSGKAETGRYFYLLRMAETQLKKARVTGKASDFETALSSYTNALWVPVPDSALLIMLYTGRGDAFRARGDFESAFEDYNKALTFDPPWANLARSRAHAARADLLVAKREFEKAAVDYDEALSLASSIEPHLRPVGLSSKAEKARACSRDIQNCSL